MSSRTISYTASIKDDGSLVITINGAIRQISSYVIKFNQDLVYGQIKLPNKVVSVIKRLDAPRSDPTVNTITIAGPPATVKSGEKLSSITYKNVTVIDRRRARSLGAAVPLVERSFVTAAVSSSSSSSSGLAGAGVIDASSGGKSIVVDVPKGANKIVINLV